VSLDNGEESREKIIEMYQLVMSNGRGDRSCHMSTTVSALSLRKSKRE